MNLILTRACTNSCPYCFAASERQADKNISISLENVIELAQWARRGNLETLSLLGGEPFLHQDLPAIISIFRKTSPGTILTIFTGGVFRHSLLDNISPDEAGIVFNVNEPCDYRNPKHFTKVMRNIELAIQKGFRVVLGFNVWRQDFDTSFMPKLAHRLGRSNFRWTVANPQLDSPSKVVSPEQFINLAKRCFTMLQEAAGLNIEALLDCPLPLCFFDAAELAYIRQYHPVTASEMGICDPTLDVTPELEALRCFALSNITRVKVTDYRNEQELQEKFRKDVDVRLLRTGCFSYCSTCPHFQTGRCYGGCLAWHRHDKIFGLESEHPRSDLAVEMFDAIQAKNSTLALSMYENSNFWAKTAVPSYLAALAAANSGQKEKSLRLANHSLANTQDPELKTMLYELLKTISIAKYEYTDYCVLNKEFPKFISFPGV